MGTHEVGVGLAVLVAQEAVDALEAGAARHVLHLTRHLQLILRKLQQLLLHAQTRRSLYFVGVSIQGLVSPYDG